MTSQISGVSQGAAGQGLGGITGALQGGVISLVNSGQGLLDRFFPPERRETLKEKLTQFATEKPMLASFLLSQIALSGVPLALFAVMSVGVLAFSIVAALVIAVVGALLFTVFCLGVALIILLPTLFVTTFAAGFIWLWAVGAYYILKWFNQKDIPGIHTGFGEGIVQQSGMKEALPDLHGNGEAKGPRNYDEGDKELEEKAAKQEQQQQQPQQPQEQGHGMKQTQTKGTIVREKSPNVGTATGVNAGGVGNLTKKVNLSGGIKTAEGVKGQVAGVGSLA